MLKIRFNARLDLIGRGWQRIKVIPFRGELTFPGKCNLAKAAPQKERNRDDDSQLRHFHSMLTTQTTLSTTTIQFQPRTLSPPPSRLSYYALVVRITTI